MNALPAPPDSVKDSVSFGRGVEGLNESVKTAQELTGNIVSYIGEWHTHPHNFPADPQQCRLTPAYISCRST